MALGLHVAFARSTFYIFFVVWNVSVTRHVHFLRLSFARIACGIPFVHFGRLVLIKLCMYAGPSHDFLACWWHMFGALVSSSRFCVVLIFEVPGQIRLCFSVAWLTFGIPFVHFCRFAFGWCMVDFLVLLGLHMAFEGSTFVC